MAGKTRTGGRIQLWLGQREAKEERSTMKYALTAFLLISALGVSISAPRVMRTCRSENCRLGQVGVLLLSIVMEIELACAAVALWMH